MKVTTEIKIIEEKIQIFTAGDGTRFESEKECTDYEYRTITECLDELAGVSCEPPAKLPDGLLPDDSFSCKWFFISDSSVFATVSRLFSIIRSENIPDMVLPFYLCVSTVDDGNGRFNDFKLFTSEDIKKIVLDYLGLFGIYPDGFKDNSSLDKVSTPLQDPGSNQDNSMPQMTAAIEETSSDVSTPHEDMTPAASIEFTVEPENTTTDVSSDVSGSSIEFETSSSGSGSEYSFSSLNDLVGQMENDAADSSDAIEFESKSDTSSTDLLALMRQMKNK